MADDPKPASERGLRSDQASGLMLVALAVYVGWANRAYPVGTQAEPGPGYMPLLLAIFMGLMGILDRKSTRVNSSHMPLSRKPSSA